MLHFVTLLSSEVVFLKDYFPWWFFLTPVLVNIQTTISLSITILCALSTVFGNLRSFISSSQQLHNLYNSLRTERKKGRKGRRTLRFLYKFSTSILKSSTKNKTKGRPTYIAYPSKYPKESFQNSFDTSCQSDGGKYPNLKINEGNLYYDFDITT